MGPGGAPRDLRPYSGSPKPRCFWSFIFKGVLADGPQFQSHELSEVTGGRSTKGNGWADSQTRRDGNGDLG